MCTNKNQNLESNRIFQATSPTDFTLSLRTGCRPNSNKRSQNQNIKQNFISKVLKLGLKPSILTPIYTKSIPNSRICQIHFQIMFKTPKKLGIDFKIIKIRFQSSNLRQKLFQSFNQQIYKLLTGTKLI